MMLTILLLLAAYLIGGIPFGYLLVRLKTGRDVAIAALLGAEEFGFATAPLVASAASGIDQDFVMSVS